ncbi:MAG TPA: hypothetical protein VKE51_09770 [Vicinamibacterales bacterium]|nr:hypothetical protein [Vicinamibacterales bacterium]
MKNDAGRASKVTTPRTVAVVATDLQPAVLDTLLDAGDYDVVFVESTERAYSCIKKTTPDLVIVCLAIDDLRSFQLLSMLALDPETAEIPVCTWVEAPQLAEFDPVGFGSFHDASAQPLVATMN